MKGIVLKSFGGVENLEMVDLPIPGIAENEVLVKTEALGVNPVDIKTRLGKGLAGILKYMDPLILGWDLSGVVTETGSQVKTFRKGDEVFGMVNFPGHGKAYAEFVAVAESHIALKPPNVSHKDAAAASLAALTAWQILNEKMTIKHDDKILIHGASGGVGHYAVQMARYLGAKVTGTSSARNKEFILSLGAAGHIDYEKLPFEDFLNKQDFVLDTIGGEYIDRSLKVLKKGGTIVSINSGASESVTEKANAIGANGFTYRVQSSGKNMNEIALMLGKGDLISYVSKSYTLDDVRSAHLHLETKRTIGKVVLTL
jgi:NADPH:quinone reductase-like Zn-dependent oxidoreductase